MAKQVVKVKGDKNKVTQSFFTRHIFEILIFTFCFILFSNSISNDYNMDDELVTINHRLTSKGFSAIPEIFTSPYYQDNMGYAYEYRPVVLASFAIEHQFFGDNPHVSHFINVLLYALCCLLLYLVLVNIGGVFTPLFSFLIALLFAAHSSHTEVVCSIKNRDEILGLIFCLLSMKIVLHALKKNRLVLLALLPLVFALALMSKITFLPFALIIILTLVLFTTTRLSILIVIAVLLAITGFLIIQSTLVFKLMITLAIPLSAIFIYYVVKLIEHGDNFWRAITKWEGPRLDFSTISVEKPEEYILVSKGASHNFFNTLSLKQYFSITPASILSLFVLLVYIYGLIVGSHLLCLLSALLLLLAGFATNEPYNRWATIALYIIIGAFTSNDYSTDIYSILRMNAIFLSIICGIFYDARRFAIASGILMALFLGRGIFYILSNPVPPHGILNQVALVAAFFAFYFAAFALLFKRGNPIKWGSLVILIICVALIRPNRIPTVVPDMVVIFAFLFVLIKKVNFKQRKYFWLFATTVAICFMVIRPTVINSETLSGQINAVKKDMYTIDTLAKVNLVNVKQERPINFVEQPVSLTDPWTIKAGTSMVVLFHYFTKVIVPYPMAFYYGYRFISPEKITEPVPICSIVIYLLLVLILLYFLKYNKTVSFGIGIYLISIATFANYFVFVPGIIADRFLLTASLGWCIIIVVALYKIFKVNTSGDKLKLSELPKGFKYTFAIILCFYSLITISRNFDWKDYTTLSKHDISYVENSSQANNLLALNLMAKSYAISDPMAQRASRVEALEHFRKALQIYPQFYNVTYDIARVYNVLNQNDSSIAYFKKALAIDSTNPTPALLIGQMLNEQGQYVQAIPYLQYATKHTIGDYQPYDKLSFAYFKINGYNQSIATNLEAIAKLQPQAAPYVNIAHVYMAINQMDSARIYLQKALPFNPNDPLVQRLLQQTGIKR